MANIDKDTAKTIENKYRYFFFLHFSKYSLQVFTVTVYFYHYINDVSTFMEYFYLNFVLQFQTSSDIHYFN